MERYHPKMIETKKYDKIKWTAKESAVFAQQLRANPVAFIASAALEPISEVRLYGGVTVDRSGGAGLAPGVAVVVAVVPP